jgi:hypothetical protein
MPIAYMFLGIFFSLLSASPRPFDLNPALASRTLRHWTCSYFSVHKSPTKHYAGHLSASEMKTNRNEVNTKMSIQVSHKVSSRADDIRANAIALLERELSEAEDTPTPDQTQSSPSTSWTEHAITFSIFIGIFYAIFTAVTR